MVVRGCLTKETFEQRLKRGEDTNHEGRIFLEEISKSEHMARSGQHNSQVAGVKMARQKVAGNKVRELTEG